MSFGRCIELQKALFEQCDFGKLSLIPDDESHEYCAHYFHFNDQRFLFRVAKKTPTKQGFFVTTWKRSDSGSIAPYDADDDIGGLVVNIVDGDQVGQLVFPKSLLIEKGVYSKEGKGGKRALRVYAPWNVVTSKQAQMTQKWQVRYFLDLTLSEGDNIARAKDLYRSFEQG